MSEDFRIKLRLQLRKASSELAVLAAGLKGMDEEIIEKKMKDFGFKYVDLFSKTIERTKKGGE